MYPPQDGWDSHRGIPHIHFRCPTVGTAERGKSRAQPCSFLYTPSVGEIEGGWGELGGKLIEQVEMRTNFTMKYFKFYSEIHTATLTDAQ